MIQLVIKVILISLISFSGLSTIALVGKERKPVTGGMAAITVIFDSLTIIGILYL